MKMLRSALLFCVIGTTLGSNILFITLLPSPSHDIWINIVADGLHAKNHNLTLIGYDFANIKSKHYTFLKIDDAEKLISDDIRTYLMTEKSLYQEIKYLWPIYLLFCEHNLKSNALKTLLEYPKDKFDLIVIDVNLPWCFYPLIEHFGNPPVVGISPFVTAAFIADAYGDHYYSYFPNYFLPYSDNMTFLQRIKNTLVYGTEIYLKWHYSAIMYKMAQERFGENIIPFKEVEKQIGLLLTNYDPILDYPLPLPPNIIPVGGIHAKPAKELSEDLQKILNNAKRGAIYFSWGTNVQPSWFAPERKQMLLDTFSKLDQIVLWKYDGDDLVNVPKNVLIQKWYRQNDILGHKNIKLFITHCGALSTQEAMYHGVPMIGIPFFLDQNNNAAKIEAKVIGRKLQHTSFTGKDLHEAIQEVLTNPIYKENIQKISNKFRDRLQSPLERAVFWIEYVLKHRNISDLSPRGRYLTYFEREKLDIIGFLLICVLLVILLFYILVKYVVNIITGKTKVDKIKKH